MRHPINGIDGNINCPVRIGDMPCSGAAHAKVVCGPKCRTADRLRLELNLLGNAQSVIDFDAKITHRAF